MSENQIDHLHISVWSCMGAWMYSYSVRDESGDLITSGGGEAIGTMRPVELHDPEAGWRRIVYEIITR